MTNDDPLKKDGEPGVYTITYLKNGDKDEEATFKVTIGSNEEYKRLEQCRVIWGQNDKNDDEKNGIAIDIYGAEIPDGSTTPIDFNKLGIFELADDKNRGEFKGFMSVQKDVDQYIDQLNKLAKAVAFSVNAIHSGQSDAGTPTNPPTDPIDADYMPFFVNSDIAKYDLTGSKRTMNNLGDILSNEVEITAGNISVNRQILDDVMQIKTRVNDDEFATADLNTVDGEKDGKRALAIASLRNTLLQIQNIDSTSDRSSFITMMGGLQTDSDLNLDTIKSDIKGMKVDNYFKDTIDKLGIHGQEAQRIVKNQGVLLQGFQERRDSISGVSLDEEMANLIQFQHAYQANAKIISTVDELLDVVVNGLKR
jgi:flagellar hook-associated protein 1 FlgK